VTAAAAGCCCDGQSISSSVAAVLPLSHRRDLKLKKKPRLLFILFVTCLHINVNKRRKKKPKEIEYSRCVNEKE
jgi:hypothetical protein